MSEQPKDDKHWEQYRKPKGSKMKKTLVALTFGCSAGFTVMFLYPKFGLPDTYTNSIKMLIGFITTMLVINLKIVFLNNPL